MVGVGWVDSEINIRATIGRVMVDSGRYAAENERQKGGQMREGKRERMRERARKRVNLVDVLLGLG